MKLWAPLPDDLAAEVRQMHEGPERGYHGWAHPLDLLEKFRTIEGMAGDALALRCAIVFHDAVYVPAAADNELCSARLAEKMLSGIVPDRSLARAVRLIEATAKHAIADETPADERDDMRLFLDLDLSILGADEAAFARYEAGVRHEYRQIEEEALQRPRGDPAALPAARHALSHRMGQRAFRGKSPAQSGGFDRQSGAGFLTQEP